MLSEVNRVLCERSGPQCHRQFIACLLTIVYPTPAAPQAVTSPSNEGASAMPPPTTDADSTTEEPEEDASVEESMLYPSSAPLLFVTHRLCTTPLSRAVEGGSSGGAFESAISYRIPYLLDGFGVGPLDPVSFTTAFCFRAAEPCLPLSDDPVPVRYDHHPPHGGPSVSLLVYSSAPSHHLVVQLGLARICEFESGALIPEPTLKRHFGEQWRKYSPPQLGRCVRVFWVRVDEEATASIGVAQRVLPPLHDIRVLLSGYTLPDALPSGSPPTPLEEGMLVSIGYATYTGWVYAAASSGGGRGWLPMGALDLLIGDPDRCPFTRIGNAMVYAEPECEDDVKDDDDEEEGDGLVEDICKRMCSGLRIAPINLGGPSLWCCAARKQQGCPDLPWKDKANKMRSLSHVMDECPKLLTVSSRSGIGESQRKAFSFDHRSARIAAKRLTFTATTVSFRIHYNKEAAGNFSLGFCDSITSENLTVDRSRSRVCGKGIAIDPISGTIYHTGTALVGMAPNPVHVPNTVVGDGGLGSVVVGLCMSLYTGDVIFLRRLPDNSALWERSITIPSSSFSSSRQAVLSWIIIYTIARGVVRPVVSSKASLLIITTLDHMEADHPYPPDLLSPRDGPGMGLNSADHDVTVVSYTVVVASSTLKDTSPAALWSLGPLVAVAAPLARTRLIISILPHRFGLEYDSTTLCDIIDSLYQAAGEHGHPFLDVQVRLNDTLPFTRGPQCPLVGAVGLMDGDKVDVLLPAVAYSEEHAVADQASLAHFDHVLFAGTFDHLHVGHRAVITRSFLMARKTLRLALVAGELLQHKRLAKALQPFHVREKEALRFVQDIRPTDWHCDVAVIPDITRDPIGPARTLRDFDCLVVTTETAKGGAVVNEARKEAGCPEVTIVEVNLRSHSSNADDGNAKISSTDTREYISGKAGGEVPLTAMEGCQQQEELIDGWWSTLRDLYLQPWRYYHTLNHVKEILDNIECSRAGNGPLPASAVVGGPSRTCLELCAWFHDAIYVPGLDDNEKASQQLWMSFCEDAAGSIDSELRDDVSTIILATENHVSSRTVYPKDQYPTLNAFLDLDLLILASPATRYQEYADGIRQEYEPVVGGPSVFAEQRSGFLSSVCSGDEAMFALCGPDAETRARNNMEMEFKHLQQQASH
ncbi:hypothetical protein FOL46_009243 [Perkinsus olseni]|uniref:Cytidyltransferase-like domain-containing protein n=1 Tax=Perkinsus olseni TaxID=32597 RepID=A0A7J6MM25_PEROL|nr:hypothetical protein FOL46_009243 [Perkinsus olseni]